MTGSGTLLDPYIIWNVDDLQDMELDHVAYYELGQDIDATITSTWHAGLGFVRICFGSHFYGQLDGKGFTISNLFINRPGDSIALFYEIGSGAVIKDFTLNVNFTGDSVHPLAVFIDSALANDDLGVSITIEDVHTSGTTTGSYNATGFAGYNSGRITFADCSSSCTVVSTQDYSGGLFYELITIIGVMTVTGATITVSRCSFTGSITCDNTNGYTGGFIGYCANIPATDTLTISDCYSTGAVTNMQAYGAARWIGGFIGFVSGATITDCYATGNVVWEGDRMGGFIGFVDAYECTITSCYATGNITGGATDSDKCGGLIGEIDIAATISECYATGNVTAGGQNLGGCIGECDVAAVIVISECFATGNITSSLPNDNVGGFIGFAGDATAISNCYARGNAAGDDYIGGFAGYSNFTITNCYSTGTVTVVGANFGGFIGDAGGACVTTDCFWDTQTSGEAADPSTATGMTTAEMKVIGTFPTWDFRATWAFSETTTRGANITSTSAVTLNGDLDFSCYNDLYPILQWYAPNTNCTFEWGTTIAYGAETAIQSQVTGDSFSQAITGLTTGIRYHYRTHAQGSDIYGDDMSFLIVVIYGADMSFNTLSSVSRKPLKGYVLMDPVLGQGL